MYVVRVKNLTNVSVFVFSTAPTAFLLLFFTLSTCYFFAFGFGFKAFCLRYLIKFVCNFLKHFVYIFTCHSACFPIQSPVLLSKFLAFSHRYFFLVVTVTLCPYYYKNKVSCRYVLIYFLHPFFKIVKAFS